MKKGWYFYEQAGDKFYSHKVESRTIYSYAGDGSKVPTPKELCDLVNSSPDTYLEDFHPIAKKYDVSDTRKEPVDLPAGTYRHQAGGPGELEKLVPISLRSDAYVVMDSVYRPIVDDMKAFIANEEVYRKIGTIYKRGILLYGPPGEGKTSLIRCVAAKEFPVDAVVIFFDSIPTTGMIETIKETLPDRMKIFVFEELANIVQNSRVERVLDFLDGEKSVDKTLMIATTNYPEQLPGNIVERPSRFDRLIKMGHPTNDERKLILNHYLMREATDEEVTATKGLSTAAIKECCFLTHLNGLTVKEAAKKLKDHSDLVKKDFAESREIGLSRRSSYFEDD